MVDIAPNPPDIGEEDDVVTLFNIVASSALQDVAELRANHKGKSREGTLLSDYQLALELFAEEATSLLQATRDFEIALGLEKAMRMDARVLEEHRTMEERASRDREMALALSEGRSPPHRPPTPLSPEVADLTADVLRMSMGTAVDDEHSDGEDENVRNGASSSAAPLGSTRKATSALFSTPRPQSRREIHNCVICGDGIHGVAIRVPCGHYYDRDCLVGLYETVTRDEELFPPRCCQREFNFEEARRYLPIQLASLFVQKAAEYRTTDRVYCHRAVCSAFLGAKTEHPSSVRCPRCSQLTCGSCKAATHPGLPCSAQADEQVLALAEELGWKRCPGCHHLVELNYGCFHMTCRCRYQFCYLCTARWKSCRCPQWDEDRLVVAAQDRVERRAREEPAAVRGSANALAHPPAVNFNALVAQEVERLRVNHDCLHTRWQYRPGRGQCEHCNFTLPNFLLRCVGCNTLACVRCRRNRL